MHIVVAGLDELSALVHDAGTGHTARVGMHAHNTAIYDMAGPDGMVGHSHACAVASLGSRKNSVGATCDVRKRHLTLGAVCGVACDVVAKVSPAAYLFFSLSFSSRCRGRLRRILGPDHPQTLTASGKLSGFIKHRG